MIEHLKLTQSEKLNKKNTNRLLGQELDPKGARYHFISRKRGVTEYGDYHLVELADGSVYSTWVDFEFDREGTAHVVLRTCP